MIAKKRVEREYSQRDHNNLFHLESPSPGTERSANCWEGPFSQSAPSGILGSPRQDMEEKQHGFKPKAIIKRRNREKTRVRKKQMAPSRAQGWVSQVLLVPSDSGQIFRKATGSGGTHSAEPSLPP